MVELYNVYESEELLNALEIYTDMHKGKTKKELEDYSMNILWLLKELRKEYSVYLDTILLGEDISSLANGKIYRITMESCSKNDINYRIYVAEGLVFESITNRIYLDNYNLTSNFEERTPYIPKRLDEIMLNYVQEKEFIL